MTPKSPQKASEEYLRSAQPRLICRVEGKGRQPVDAGDRCVELTPLISEAERGWDDVISEDYDPNNSPLGCRVYWRVINRGEEQLYCSTFLAKRDLIIKGWGTKALAYCDPVTGMAVAQIETLLSGSAKRLDADAPHRSRKAGTYQ